MSEVTFVDSDRYIIICQNHNKEGRVCAALSAIMYGLVWYLEKWGEVHEVNEENGYLEIHFGKDLQCNTLYRYIIEAVKGIENTYPESLIIRVI